MPAIVLSPAVIDAFTDCLRADGKSPYTIESTSATPGRSHFLRTDVR